MRTVGLISLGCPRNGVDSEIILGILQKGGFRIRDVEENPDILIINTCSFIDSARRESVESILEAAQAKKEGLIKHLVVCGCLSQLYKGRLVKELPEVDLFVGTGDFSRIDTLIRGLSQSRVRAVISARPRYLYNEQSPRVRLTPPHYAYVKVSEGCDNRCSYCIISRVRGPLRSRTVRSVIEEVKGIAATGALKEVNLIGQDTTSFGVDRDGIRTLPALLKRLCALENGIRWFRILYTHPAHYSDRFLGVVRDEGRLAKYLDIPIQHASDAILKRMNRKTTKKELASLIRKIRRTIPGVVLRTSVIVGFPGETERDLQELIGFLKEARFEKLGAFVYSREDATKAGAFMDQIPERVKRSRFDEVMKAQQAIARDINASFLGREVDVLIDERAKGEKDVFLARTEGDAPEIDGTVSVRGRGLRIGAFYTVKITDTLDYDLVGHVA